MNHCQGLTGLVENVVLSTFLPFSLLIQLDNYRDIFLSWFLWFYLSIPNPYSRVICIETWKLHLIHQRASYVICASDDPVQPWTLSWSGEFLWLQVHNSINFVPGGSNTWPKSTLGSGHIQKTNEYQKDLRDQCKKKKILAYSFCWVFWGV